MTLDLHWPALICAGVASVTIGLRGMMLKPTIQSAPVAPRPVTLALIALAATYAGAAVHIYWGGVATWRETAVYAVSALSGVVLLANLALQGWGRAGRTTAAKPEAKP